MLITVITINRNNLSSLERTAISVLSQSLYDFEYVIVDGNSDDGSAEYLNEHLNDDRVLWISEPDGGIYNAMNKAVRMSSGEYLLFLNSGDTFASPDVLSHITGNLFDADIVVGRVNVVDGDVVVRQSKLLDANDLHLFSMYLQGIPHQAAFIRRTLMLEHPYDESLKINSDWKFFVETIVLENRPVKLISDIVANYDNAGLSSTHMDLLLAERERVFRELIPPRIADDYLAVFPHYYEVKRVSWLLKHPFFYKVYRSIATLGMKILK